MISISLKEVVTFIELVRVAQEKILTLSGSTEIKVPDRKHQASIYSLDKQWGMQNMRECRWMATAPYKSPPVHECWCECQCLSGGGRAYRDRECSTKYLTCLALLLFLPPAFYLPLIFAAAHQFFLPWIDDFPAVGYWAWIGSVSESQWSEKLLPVNLECTHRWLLRLWYKHKVTVVLIYNFSGENHDWLLVWPMT